MTATQAILDDFTQKTGIKTKLVPVPEDQLATLMTNAAAAGELPDVVLATPLDQSQQYALEGIFDADAAQAVVDKLGVDTFSKKALDLVSADGKATGVPSDGWGQLLIYRKDLFEKAGLEAPQSLDDVRAAAEELNGDGMAGITLATKPGDGFTSETFEHVALAQGCQIVDDGGKVTFDSPPCVEALRWYGDIASNYSVSGAQDVESTRGTYFAGKAAMMFWSPFLLDGMAGLRADTKPSCEECKDDPAFLAKNSGLVGPLTGAGGTPSQFGSVSTVNISVDAPTEDAQKLAEFMLSDGYVRWLGLSPQGKYPVRAGDSSDPKKFQTAWAGLESGVDTKAPLTEFYSEDSVASLADGVANFQRWGFAQGQGALMGALRGEQPIASAVADVIGGKDPAEAAKEVQSTVEEIQSGLE
ncbi:extracellular solute-binding protein [Solirubrobacter sp. CPCC 204708]|nr:extracellular solute-binding protein [Solirubrobacter deserti]